MRKNVSLFVTTLLLCLFAFSQSASAGKSKPVPGSNGLVQFKTKKFNKVIAASDTALQGYSSIMFMPVQFSDFKVVKKSKKIRKSWVFSDEEKEKINDYFQHIATQEFSQEKQTIGLSTKAKEGVLKAEFRLVELHPKREKPGAGQSTIAGSRKISDYGNLAVQIVLVDAMSGKFVAVFQDAALLDVRNLTKETLQSFHHTVKREMALWLNDLQKVIVEYRT